MEALTSKGAPRCVGLKCGPAVPGSKPKRYTAQQCKEACTEGSNLCSACMRQQAANLANSSSKKFHGRFGETPAPWSHIEGSAWNMALRAKNAAKAAADAEKEGRKVSTKVRKVRAKTAKKNRNGTRRVYRPASAISSNNVGYASAASAAASASRPVRHPASAVSPIGSEAFESEKRRGAQNAAIASLLAAQAPINLY